MKLAARCLALMVGVSAAALGAVGAYQLQASIDGPTSYLAIAAPVVALAAAVIPYLAEQAWRAKHYAKAVALWLVLVPAAAVMFFGAAERVHSSKAAGEAERLAAAASVTRAERELEQARAAAAAATAAADRVRGLNARSCNARCLSIRASEDAARARALEADAALRKVQGVATAASPIAAPVWLLPAALDLVAFVAIWAGLASDLPAPAPRPEAKPAPKPARQRKRKAAPVVKLRPVVEDHAAWRAELARQYPTGT